MSNNNKPCEKKSHDWNYENGEGDTCLKCGDKDWMADESCSESKLQSEG